MIALCSELSQPHQSDLHHELFGVASLFEIGPNWFGSIENAMRVVIGNEFTNLVKTLNWKNDGSDFYMFLERLIEATFDEEKLETANSNLFQALADKLIDAKSWREQYKYLYPLVRPKSPDNIRKQKKLESDEDYLLYLKQCKPRKQKRDESIEKYIKHLKSIAPRPRNNEEKEEQYENFLMERAQKARPLKYQSFIKGNIRVRLHNICKKMLKNERKLTKSEISLIEDFGETYRKKQTEIDFIKKTIPPMVNKSLASDPRVKKMPKLRRSFTKEDTEELSQKVFIKLVQWTPKNSNSPAFDPTQLKQKKFGAIKSIVGTIIKDAIDKKINETKDRSTPIRDLEDEMIRIEDRGETISYADVIDGLEPSHRRWLNKVYAELEVKKKKAKERGPTVILRKKTA